MDISECSSLSLKDSKSNVIREIITVMYYSDKPCTVWNIRCVLKQRFAWQIGIKTIQKFVDELSSNDRVKPVGRVFENNLWSEGYTLTDREKHVRRFGYFEDEGNNEGVVQGRKGGGIRVRRVG